MKLRWRIIIGIITSPIWIPISILILCFAIPIVFLIWAGLFVPAIFECVFKGNADLLRELLFIKKKGL